MTDSIEPETRRLLGALRNECFLQTWQSWQNSEMHRDIRLSVESAMNRAVVKNTVRDQADER